MESRLRTGISAVLFPTWRSCGMSRRPVDAIGMKARLFPDKN